MDGENTRHGRGKMDRGKPCCTDKCVFGWNGCAGVLHLVILFTVLGLLYDSSGNFQDVKFETIDQFAREVENDGIDESLPQINFSCRVLQPDIQLNESFPPISLKLLILLFSGVTAFSHFVLCCDSKQYYEILRDTGGKKPTNGAVNWVRYVEYSITASIMIVIIALEIGISQWSTLVGLIGCTWSCMMFGLLADIISRLQDTGTLYKWADTGKWIAHFAGWMAIIFPFFVIIITFQNVFRDSEAPDYVSLLIWGETLFFVCFGVVQSYQLYSTDPCRFRKAESWYIFLSLTSKAFLTGIVFSYVFSKSPCDLCTQNCVV